MKLAVIYDSKTNNTAAVAGYMADGMNSIEGVEQKHSCIQKPIQNL